MTVLPFCGKCGNELLPDEKFCGVCGTSISESGGTLVSPPTGVTQPPVIGTATSVESVINRQSAGTPGPGKRSRNFLIPIIIAIIIIGVIAAVLLVGIPGMSKTSAGKPGNTPTGGSVISHAFEGDWQVMNAAESGSVQAFRITILPDNTVTASFPMLQSEKISGSLSDGGSTLKGTYSDNVSGETGTFTIVLSDNNHFSGTWQSHGHSYSITGEKGPQVLQTGISTLGTTPISQTSATQATGTRTTTIKADFTVDTNSGSIPLTVSFTDLSTGSPDQWFWDFGDGTHSTEKSPVHTFKTEGSFTVTLNIDKNGQTSSKSQGITASSLPLTANFVADQTSGTAPLTVTFTDTSRGSPTTWIWQFGNGQISYERNPEMTYQGSGTYTVQLTVEKSGIQSKKSEIVNVYSPSPITTIVTTTALITSAVTSEFYNGNIYAVYNNPTKPTVVTFGTPVKIISITNYHWNNGKGASPGKIALKHSDGTLYGWWSASGQPGSGGVSNAYWLVNPSVTAKAGTYTVLDSDPSTWAQNSQSGNAGMTRIVYQQV